MSSLLSEQTKPSHAAQTMNDTAQAMSNKSGRRAVVVKILSQKSVVMRKKKRSGRKHFEARGRRAQMSAKHIWISAIYHVIYPHHRNSPLRRPGAQISQ